MLSSSLNALIALILLPIMTRYLSPYDYGVVETFAATVALFAGLVLLGSSSYISKEYFNFEESRRIDVLNKNLGFVLISAVIVVFLGIVVAQTGIPFNVLKISDSAFATAIFVACLTAIISWGCTLLQLQKRAADYGVFMNSKTVFELATSLLLVVALGYKWEGRLTSIVFTNIVFTIAILYWLSKSHIRPAFPGRYAVSILRFGLPMAIAHAGVWVTGMVDRVIINNILDVSATGLYSVGYRFGMVISMLESAFSLAWLPFFFEALNNKDAESERRVVRVTYKYIIVLLVSTVVYGCLGPYLLRTMVDPAFESAGSLVLLISLGFCFSGISKMFVGYLMHAGRSTHYLIVTCIGAGVNIALNVILLQRIGLLGAAWALCISMAFTMLMTIVLAVRSHRMPWISGTA